MSNIASGYEIKVCCTNPQVATIQFQVPYRDWCKFENSHVWRSAIDRIENLQKGCNR